MRPGRKIHPRGELIEGYVVSEHPLYGVYNGMLQRCYNKERPNFPDYGGRGIKVCERWMSFKTFVKDIGPRPSEAHTIERKDNDGDYEPSNCVWATRTAQCLNRRVFKNNTTSERGVVVAKDRFTARFDYEGVRYDVGRFDTIEEAAKARATFIKQFLKDRDAAIATLSRERVWCTSSTKIRGVTPHKDGGYTVRQTVRGVRKYLGYFKTLKGAIDAKRRADEV